MSITYNQDTSMAKTAKELLAAQPALQGKNNYYMLWPNGRSSPGELVYCDMTTDGGGWMMIARSHPTTVNFNGQNWGWRGGKIGSVKDFSQSYQAGWELWHTSGSTFTEFIFGNRSNINNNEWGPFIYKRFGINYTTFVTSDTQQSASSSVIKTNTNVYGSSTFPGMQGAIGFPITGTNNNIYYMRDCCGFSAAWGGRPTSLGTTYCNDSARYSSGPWCNGSSSDGNGDFIQGGTAYGDYIHGGTNQYMIMVR